MRLMVSGVNFTNGCFCLGKYALHDVDRNGNHIYKHVLNDAYLYYKGTYWAVSELMSKILNYQSQYKLCKCLPNIE